MRLDLNFGKEHAAATVQEHARLQLPGETGLLEPTEVEGSDGRYSVSFFSSDIANASHLPAEAALQWSGRTDHPLSRQLTIIDADVAEEQGSASAGDVHQAADRYLKFALTFFGEPPGSQDLLVFRCQMCGTVSPAGTKSHKLTVKVRQKEYQGTIEEAPRRRRGRFPEPRKPRDRGGSGHEIVREVTVCESCYNQNLESQTSMLEAIKAGAQRHHRDDDDDDGDGDDE